VEGYNTIIEQIIRWGDMDSLGHVNNILFFRYMENVRIEYYEKINFWNSKKITGLGPIIASTSCKFKAPLTYPDTVSVGAKTIKLDDDRFTMKFSIVSHKLKREVAEGDAIVVSYDYNNNKKALIPAEVSQKIKELDF
jgi:acyl-CoA thioester hydrolase